MTKKWATHGDRPYQVHRRESYFFGVVFGCSGFWFGVVLASGLELGVVPVVEFGEEPVFELGLVFMSEDVPAPAPPLTLMLSTTLRFPAKDCAMRRASSRSFSEGALPLSVIVSEVASTVMLLLESVGSLLKAVLMSLFTWSTDSPLAPVVLLAELL